MTVDLDILRKTTEKLLHSRGVLDVDAFGWLNENDVDPEFVGYAMWALSPPYDHHFLSWQNDTLPNRAPTEDEQRLMELGHDFFGLMKTARHFIGEALLHQPAVQPFHIEPTDFDFNEFAALTALTAAADRLRDFIIVTSLGITAKKRSKKTWQEFNEACNKLRVASFAVEADALQEGFKAIHNDARKARNEAVHELATRPAHVQKHLITRDREAFEKRRWEAAKDQEIPYEELDTKELSAVEARAKLLCDCHIKLVKVGEVCFRAEHDWRQRGVASP